MKVYEGENMQSCVISLNKKKFDDCCVFKRSKMKQQRAKNVKRKKE